MARLPLLLTACIVAAVLTAPAAAAPDPVVPFPVPTSACDALFPPGWPVTTSDPWCGTWDAGANTPQTPDSLVMPPLGRITLRRVSPPDARTLFFYDAVGAAAFPPLTDMLFDGFADRNCAEMLVNEISTTRYYLGTFESGDERGYIGACSDLAMFPDVLNGGYVSQTSADTSIDRWQRIRRRGNFSLRLQAGSTSRADGELAPIFSEYHPGASQWTFGAVRLATKPAVPAGAPAGQPPIYGRPLYRVLRVRGGLTVLHSAGDAKDHAPRVGWLLGDRDHITIRRTDAEPAGTASVTLQRLDVDGSALGEVEIGTTYVLGESVGTEFWVDTPLPSLTGGAAELTGDAGIGTPPAQVIPGGADALERATATPSGDRARVIYDPRTKVARVADRAGRVAVVPANASLSPVVLSAGQEVLVSPTSIGAPFALVPDEALADLAVSIPAPRVVRAGPATVTAPGRLSLRALAHSKCVRVAVRSSRPARVLVTIFSGRRSIRLFGQRLVRFRSPGRVLTCIRVPRHARTFDVRTPLRFAVGYALGARARAGERPPRPVIRPIRLVP